MPIYTFRCLKCDQRIHKTLPLTSEKEEPTCECGGETVRVFFPPSVIYRPGGFYTTDKRLDTDGDD